MLLQGLINPLFKPSPHGLLLQSRFRVWVQKQQLPEVKKRLKNRRLKAHEFHVAGSGPGGTFNLVPPWPPHINRTIRPWPNPSYEFLDKKKFPLRYKNIEIQYQPSLIPGPHTITSPIGGKMERIVHPIKNTLKPARVE